MNRRLVNTRELFIALLRDLAVDVVCDVGSMNGEDALAFRARLPRARIIAMEPNPLNLHRMRTDPRLRAAGIDIIGAAASHHDSRAPLYVVEADYASRDARRGMSSLHRRDRGVFQTTTVDVNTLRLDTLLAPMAAHGARIALWIDVEGHACEVLEGLGLAASRVVLMHVEVESEPCIARTQRLYPEARAMLEASRFTEMATDHDHSHPQFNALFLRADLGAGYLDCANRRLRHAQWRRAFIDLLGRLCPACRRRLGELRRRVSRRIHGGVSKQPPSGSTA